jgi:hypothetical protein
MYLVVERGEGSINFVAYNLNLLCKFFFLGSNHCLHQVKFIQDFNNLFVISLLFSFFCEI